MPSSSGSSLESDSHIISSASDCKFREYCFLKSFLIKLFIAIHNANFE